MRAVLKTMCPQAAAPATEKLYASVRGPDSHPRRESGGDPACARRGGEVIPLRSCDREGPLLVARKIDCEVASMIPLDRASYYESASGRSPSQAFDVEEAASGRLRQP